MFGVTIAHRQALQPVTDAGGTLKVMAAPFRMSAANTAVRGFCADLGQHTDEVLRELLGYGDADLAKLKKSGVTSTTPTVGDV